MTFWQWICLAVTAAVLCLILRRQQPEMASLVALAAGCMLLFSALESVNTLREYLERIVSLGGLKPEYITTLMKVLGVSYISEIAEQTCADLGEGGLAAKVALAGRLSVFVMAAPLLMELLESILGLVP